MQRVFSKNISGKPLYEITSYSSSSLTLSSLGNAPAGKYPVYDASGVSRYIDTYQMTDDYIAIIKDGSGVGNLQFCNSKSNIIGTLGAIMSNVTPIKYIYYFLQTVDFKPYITGMAIPHIYYKDYGKLIVPIPSDNEIKNIILCFDEIDRIIKNQELIYHHYKVIRQALLQKMFI